MTAQDTRVVSSSMNGQTGEKVMRRSLQNGNAETSIELQQKIAPRYAEA